MGHPVHKFPCNFSTYFRINNSSLPYNPFHTVLLKRPGHSRPPERKSNANKKPGAVAYFSGGGAAGKGEEKKEWDLNQTYLVCAFCSLLHISIYQIIPYKFDVEGNGYTGPYWSHMNRYENTQSCVFFLQILVMIATI